MLMTYHEHLVISHTDFKHVTQLLCTYHKHLVISHSDFMHVTQMVITYNEHLVISHTDFKHVTQKLKYIPGALGYTPCCQACNSDVDSMPRTFDYVKL